MIYIFLFLYIIIDDNKFNFKRYVYFGNFYKGVERKRGKYDLYVFFVMCLWFEKVVFIWIVFRLNCCKYLIIVYLFVMIFIMW